MSDLVKTQSAYRSLGDSPPDAKRRRLMLLCGLTLAGYGSSGVARAAAATPLRLALLSDNDLFEDGKVQMESLRRGLAQLGYEEGKNLVIERRNAKRDKQAFALHTSELVEWKPDMFVAASTTAAFSLQKETLKSRTPVVFWSTDPVESGIVASLERPGANLTGVTDPSDTQQTVLDAMQSIVPGLKKVGLFYNATYAPAPATLAELRNAAKPREIEIVVYDIPLDVEQFDDRAAAIKADAIEAAVVGPHPYFNMNGARIGSALLNHGIVGASITRSVLQAGGVITVTPDFATIWQDAAQSIGKILKGADPATLPVVRSRNLLLLNHKSAAALGRELPEALLKRADQVLK